MRVAVAETDHANEVKSGHFEGNVRPYELPYETSVHKCALVEATPKPHAASLDLTWSTLLKARLCSGFETLAIALVACFLILHQDIAAVFWKTCLAGATIVLTPGDPASPLCTKPYREPVAGFTSNCLFNIYK